MQIISQWKQIIERFFHVTRIASVAFVPRKW